MAHIEKLETFWRRMDLIFKAPDTPAGEQPPIDVKLRSGDIVISGCAKTGTTWMQQIVHQLRSKGDMSFSDIFHVVPWIPFHFQLTADFDPNVPAQRWTPRVFKDHDTYAWMPGKADGVRYIAIARDPVDCTWSFAKFIVQWLAGVDTELSGEDMLRILKNPAFSTGIAINYHDWLLDWFPHRNDVNVLFVHYEDLIEDLPACMKAIAKFAGIEATPAEIAIAVEHSSHSFMSKHKEKFIGDDKALTTMFEGLKEEWKPATGMVRVDGGKVGQGQKEVQPEVRKYLDEEWEAKICKTLGFRSYQEMRAVSSLLSRCKNL